MSKGDLLKVQRLSQKEGLLADEEIELIKYYGKKHGFRSNEDRLKAYMKILFRDKESKVARMEDLFEKKEPSIFENVKESSVIDKDAIRSQFNHFQGEELKKVQQNLAAMLKSVFATYSEATYYQGLNEVMATLQREYQPKEALILFEGLINAHLW